MTFYLKICNGKLMRLTKKQINDLIERIEQANAQSQLAINLVPSETRMPAYAHQLLSYDFYNRYFFNDQRRPDFWEFRGGQSIADIEREIIIPAFRRLSQAKYVNIRPISGLNTSLVTISAYTQQHPGGTVVSIDPAYGGHFAMGGLISRLGLESKQIEASGGQVNLSELHTALVDHDVSLVYVDLQNTLHHLQIREIATLIKEHSPSTILHVDASHIMGLVLGKAHQNPLVEGADSFGGSTHKSFPGPQKGIVFTNEESLAASLEQAQFDLISSHHFAETIALGIIALEFERFGETYANAMIENARVLAQQLQYEGFDIQGVPPTFTDTHQIWFNAGDLEETNTLSQRLFDVGIRANFQQRLPNLPMPSFRLGTNEVTLEGATSHSMQLIAKAFGCARDGEVPQEFSASAIRETFTFPYYLKK
jgi:glycine hydroxymethyltransferase